MLSSVAWNDSRWFKWRGNLWRIVVPKSDTKLLFRAVTTRVTSSLDSWTLYLIFCCQIINHAQLKYHFLDFSIFHFLLCDTTCLHGVGLYVFTNKHDCLSFHMTNEVFFSYPVAGKAIWRLIKNQPQPIVPINSRCIVIMKILNIGDRKLPTLQAYSVCVGQKGPFCQKVSPFTILLYPISHDIWLINPWLKIFKRDFKAEIGHILGGPAFRDPKSFFKNGTVQCLPIESLSKYRRDFPAEE